MNKNDEITIELAKNKADEFVAKKEIEKAKRDFIENLQKNFGDEIKATNNMYYTHPIKIKKPFRYKIYRFIDKMKKIFGF